MPLRVHCPNSCLIRMPNNRAGRIVRCPKCKAPIRIPPVTESELASGKPISCHAKIARPRQSAEDENSTEFNPDLSPDNLEIISQSELDQPQPDATTSDASTQQPRLPLPDVLKPIPGKNPVFAATPSIPGANSQEQPAAAGNASSGDEPQPDEIEPTAFPIIDTKSEAESPDDWIDGEGIEILVRDAAKYMPTKPKSAKPIGANPDAAKPVAATVSEATASDPVESGAVTTANAVDAPTNESKLENEEQERASLPVPVPSDGNPIAAIETTHQPQVTQRAIDRVDLPKPGTKSPRAADGTAVSSSEPRLDILPSAASLLIDLGLGAGEFAGPHSEHDWQERLEKANSDRKVLARFFALCLCIVSIVNMVPAIYHWYHWTQLIDSMPLPRWIYILIFVGAVHFIYAIFLAQLPDWSAMRAVSVAMLAVAFVFGFVSTGLLVGGGQGNLTGFLGIPFTLNRQACIWCVAMLCLATLMSYWGGRESSNWQRAEHLLREILSTSTGQA